MLINIFEDLNYVNPSMKFLFWMWPLCHIDTDYNFIVTPVISTNAIQGTDYNYIVTPVV